MKTLAKLVIGASLAALANPASAAEWLYFNTGGSVSGAGRTFTDGTVNVRASAWSVDLATKVRQATLGYYSEGLGVTYGNDNSHTVDNKGTRDFVLLQFDKAVTLDSAMFKTGWHSMKDTDATIGFADLDLAYTAQPGFNNQFAAFALKDFTTYSSGSFGKSGNSTRAINLNSYTGDTWLVAAGSPLSPDLYADGFKLKGVSYSVAAPAVPEPATWAMLLLGFGSIGAVLRSRPARTRVRYA